jgi:hypothetical protein
MHLCALLALLLPLAGPTWGADYDVFPDLGINDPASLKEASRVLEEELRLAARPQTYLLVDLVARRIAIKARGVVLLQIPIVGWSGSASDQMAKPFRLIARPPVVRPRIDPSSAAEQEPIALADMPTHYRVTFSPPFNLEIIPSAGEDPIQWAWAQVGDWWRQLGRWSSSLIPGHTSQSDPALRIALLVEQAQSLAWSMVDGMALVIRRPADQ